MKALLASVDPDLPIHEWNRLIPQAELTLNLLRASIFNPILLAWAYLFGKFDWMCTPLAPPGTNVLVHLKPDNRSTWLPNGGEGWTIVHLPKQYYCIQVYFPKKRRQRNLDTVTFFPTIIPFPQVKLDIF